MLARYTGGTRSAYRTGWRPRTALIVGSLLAHLLLVLAAVGLYRPAQRAAAVQQPSSSPPIYFDLPPLPSIATSPPAPAALPGTAGTYTPARPPAALPRVAAQSEPDAVPDAPPDPAPTGSRSAPQSQAAARPNLRSAPLDPRLHLDMRALPPTPGTSGPRRIIADVHEIIRAREDSAARRKGEVSVLRRRPEPIDSGGPRGRGLRLNISGERVTMPGDGREWNDLEMRNQQVTTSRDSLLRERIRETRERNDARRRAKNP